MTKEEVLKIIDDKFYTDYIFDGEDEVRQDALDRDALADEILTNVKSYAKQQAIAFMNWTLSGDCDTYSCTDENQWTNVFTNQNITTEQLYNIFIEQQNKP